MGKYYFKSKFKAPIHIVRNKRLCILLGIKDNTVIETFGGCSPNSEEHKERMEVFQYFYKLGKDDKFIESQWLLTQSERRKQGSVYKKKPKRERRDNQNPVTNTKNYGGSSGNYPTVRVPSKKHKNRWKNFIKLFPYFKDK